MYFNVKDICTDNYTRDYTEDYGEWSEENDHNLVSASISNDKYWDVALFPSEVEPTRGQDIYVVYVLYSSGDSFGHSSGNLVYIWAFTDPKKAYELSDLILTDYAKQPDFSFDKNGNEFTFYGQTIYCGTWKGYFERLQEVEVAKLCVTK